MESLYITTGKDLSTAILLAVTQDVHIIHLLKLEGITMLGQLTKYEEYKIFYTSTAVVKRMHCYISVTTMVTKMCHLVTLSCS